MSAMLASHLVVQNAAALTKWYAELLSATSRSPAGSGAGTPNWASTSVSRRMPVVSSPSSDPEYGSGSAGLATDQNRWQGECSVPGQVRSYASSSAPVDSNYFCASRRL
jgi:hypothetical protein